MINKEQANDRNQLWWRCRRSTQELDLLLFYYMDNHYDQATAVEQQAFANMLEWSDPKLYAFLCAVAGSAEHTADSPYTRVARLIHARHQTKVL